MSDEHISKISDAYKNQKELEGISKLITPEQVKSEDYNFSVSTYIDKSSQEKEIDIDKLELEIWDAYMKNIQDIFSWYENTINIRETLGMGMNKFLPDLREKNSIIFQNEKIKITTR